MGLLSLDCPHQGCRLERAAFNILVANCPAAGVYEAFCICSGCHHAVIAELFGSPGRDLVTFQGNVQNMANTTLDVMSVWPDAPSIDTPQHTPQFVERFYHQAFDNMQRGNHDAAGMMFRKTLETAIKDLHPDGKGRLVDRIDNLPDEIGVTKSMKKWAHEIRTIGNESAHDEPETEADIRATYNFTNMFLKYAYEMPGLLEERKTETGDGSEE